MVTIVVIFTPLFGVRPACSRRVYGTLQSLSAGTRGLVYWGRRKWILKTVKKMQRSVSAGYWKQLDCSRKKFQQGCVFLSGGVTVLLYRRFAILVEDLLMGEGLNQ